MSLYSKLIQAFCLCFCVALTSCTFAPLYNEATEQKLSEVFVATIPDREGQLLRNKLRFLMENHGDDCRAKYTLNIKLSTLDRALGINRSGTITRKNRIITATFDLVDREKQVPVYRSSAKVENPYVIQQSQFYSNPITEEHATQESLELLAQLIKAELAMHFSRNED